MSKTKLGTEKQRDAERQWEQAQQIPFEPTSYRDLNKEKAEGTDGGVGHADRAGGLSQAPEQTEKKPRSQVAPVELLEEQREEAADWRARVLGAAGTEEE